MKRGVQWLIVNQYAAQGEWPTYSINKQRDLTSDMVSFMSDAATIHAVMALEATHR